MIVSPDLDKASLGAVLKTALDAVVVMRMDGTIAGWNDVAERSFGWSFAEAQGRRMSEIIIPDRHRSSHEQGLAHYLATGEGPVLDQHIEIEALHRAGHEIPVELSITRTEQFGEPVFLGFLRDISERREAARRQELLIGELNHRVRNMLGVISSIAHQSARDAADLPSFTRNFTGRIDALGRAHDILTAAVWEPAPLASLVQSLTGPYRHENRISVTGDATALEPRQLLAMSMILHELLINAVKYGALATPQGHVAIEWASEDGRVTFGWTESGLDDIAAPERSGFGSKLIELSVRHDLGGAMERNWNADGVAYRLDFPLGVHMS